MKSYLVLKFKGKPISKSNYKGISKYPSKKTGMHYPILSLKYKEYEKGLQQQAKLQLPVGFKPFTSNVWISLFLHFKDRRHGDILNMCKSIGDALQGIIWKNDKQCWVDKMMPIYNKTEGFTLVVRLVVPEGFAPKDKYKLINKKKHSKKYKELIDKLYKEYNI